jgi:CHAD domain-containing protein
MDTLPASRCELRCAVDMAKKAKDTFPLLRYADGLVEDLRRLVPKVVKQWDADATHQARVATRRLKAVVDVLKPVLSGDNRKSFEKVLRQLRRRLGPLRDIDVMIGHLSDVKGARLRPARAWIGDRSKNRRDELRKTALKKITPAKMLARLGSWWGVREELAECHQAVDTLLAESVHLQLDAFVERAEALVANKPANAADPAVADPHELRIAAKGLRYAIEMAIVENHRLPAGVVRTFKQMQDSLGFWHDYVVLADCIMQISTEEMLAAHDASLQLSVLDVARSSVQSSARQLGRFNSLWRSRGEELARTIRESFPLTHPAPPPSVIASVSNQPSSSNADISEISAA